MIKILSWNIWVDGNMSLISDFLKKSDADIIGLQEVKENDPGRDVIGYLSSLGYEYVFAPRQIHKRTGVHFGPAVFSKYKIESSRIHSLSKKEERVAVQANIRVGNHILHVFSTHLSHTHQRESEIQVEQGLNLIKLLPNKNTIVMGDFNATPESLTIKNMQKALVDTDPSSNSTWSLYPEGCPVCKPQSLSIRLDYIFTSKDVSVKSFEVGNSKGSDHLPVLITVEI